MSKIDTSIFKVGNFVTNSHYEEAGYSVLILYVGSDMFFGREVGPKPGMYGFEAAYGFRQFDWKPINFCGALENDEKAELESLREKLKVAHIEERKAILEIIQPLYKADGPHYWAKGWANALERIEQEIQNRGLS